MAITQNVKNRLEEKITYLPEKQAKGKQYSRRNKEQLTVKPSSIPDEDLENTVVYMFKDSGIDVGLEILSDVTNSLSQVLVEVIIKKSNSQVYQSGTLESSVEAQKTNKRVKIKACL